VCKTQSAEENFLELLALVWGITHHVSDEQRNQEGVVASTSRLTYGSAHK
jgi:hypothetical protein